MKYLKDLVIIVLSPFQAKSWLVVCKGPFEYSIRNKKITRFVAFVISVCVDIFYHLHVFIGSFCLVMANFAVFVLTCRLKIRFLRRASMIPSCNSKLAILSRKTQRTLQCARVRFLHTNNKSPLLPYRDEPLLALAVLHPRKLVVYRVSRLLIATPRPCLFPPQSFVVALFFRDDVFLCVSVITCLPLLDHLAGRG